MSYHPQPDPNPFWAQATWYIDPANSTGLASDDQSGIDAAHPVLSYNGGVVSKWGTTSPTLRQDTAITWLSSQPSNAADPVICEAVMVNSVLTLQGQLAAPVASGNIAGVTAKNRATGQLLQVDFGVALANGLLVKNTTAGKTSFAWVYAQTAPAPQVKMTQPLAPFAPPLPEISVVTEVDTWGPGDTFDAYQPIAVNLVRVSPTMVNPAPPNFPCPVQLYHLLGNTVDGGNSSSNFSITDDVTMVESSFLSLLVDEALGDDLIRTVANCSLLAGVYGALGTFDETNVFGGALLQAFVGGGCTWSFDYDAVIDATGATDFALGTTSVQPGYGIPALGEVYVAGVLCPTGALSAYNGGTPSGASLVWGPGTLDLKARARLVYNGAHTAVATFVNAGGLQINGSATANPFDPAAGTFAAALAITPANLDAAYGAPGFGGNAVNPSGGAIVATASF